MRYVIVIALVVGVEIASWYVGSWLGLIIGTLLIAALLLIVGVGCMNAMAEEGRRPSRVDLADEALGEHHPVPTTSVSRFTEPNAKPMPEQRKRLEVHRKFSSGEYRIILRGLRARDMDDKWFSYAEGDTVYFHRSWTGFCFYEVHFHPERDGGASIEDVIVNRDPRQKARRDDRYDAEFLTWLIDCIVLGRDVPLPVN